MSAEANGPRPIARKPWNVSVWQWLRYTHWVLFVGLCAAILWLNVRAYAAPRGATVRGEIADDAIAQLDSIGRRLRDGEGADMQRIFPEGWFFSHALYGMAWVNVRLQADDDAVRRRAAEEARWVLQRMDTREGIGPFAAATQVEHGVFYLGWKNRLLGGLLALNWHQGTVCEAAAHAVPFLIELAADPQTPDRVGVLSLLGERAGGTSYRDVHGNLLNEPDFETPSAGGL